MALVAVYVSADVSDSASLPYKSPRGKENVGRKGNGVSEFLLAAIPLGYK